MGKALVGVFVRGAELRDLEAKWRQESRGREVEPVVASHVGEVAIAATPDSRQEEASVSA